MKKAKSPQDLSEKATDIMSLIKKFTSKSDENSPPKSNNGGAQSNNNKQSFPQPPTYNYSAFAHIIEKHDKKVKKIISDSQKQKADGQENAPKPAQKRKTGSTAANSKTGIAAPKSKTSQSKSVTPKPKH